MAELHSISRLVPVRYILAANNGQFYKFILLKPVLCIVGSEKEGSIAAFLTLSGDKMLQLGVFRVAGR